MRSEHPSREVLLERNRQLAIEVQAERDRTAALAATVLPNGATSNSAANADLIAAISAVVEQRVRAALGGLPLLPEEAAKAYRSRYAARARGFFWVDEFASVIGRHNQYVSDRCSDGRIRTLVGGKPYRIPLSEEARWNAPAN